MADELRADVGGDIDGENIIGSKGVQYDSPRNATTVNVEIPPPVKAPLNHPVRQYTLADVVIALIGDPLTGTPGLVSEIKNLEQQISDVKRAQYPRWFQALIIVMATVLIVLLSLLLFELRFRGIL